MEVRFNQIMKIKHGYAFEGESYSDEPTKWSLLTPANFTLSGGFQETDRYYKEDGASFPSEFILSKDDLIVTMTDLSKEIDTIGFSALVPTDNKYLHNQRIGLVTITDNRIDKYYLYWLMRTKFYQRFVAGSSNGATVHHTSPDRIMKFKWNFPLLPTQQKIASILSAYDNLIQNYKKQIEALQTAASEFYKEWFVRFRFPGWQTAKFENGIPKGWKLERLGNLFEITSSKRVYEEDYVNEGIPFYRSKEIIELSNNHEITTELFISNELYNKFKNKFGVPKENDILITSVGSIGNSYQVRKEDIFYFKDGNLTWIKSSSNKALSKYLIYWLKSDLGKNTLISSTIGTSQSALTIEKLKAIKILVPEIIILENFEQKVFPSDTKIQILNKQITNLTQQRDLLLPRLMSGKLEVK